MTLQSTSLALPAHSHLALGRIEIWRSGQDLSRRFNFATTSIEPRYDLIVPCRATIRFCQGGLTGDVPAGSYVLLRRDSFYEISSDEDLAHWRVSLPVRDLRQRLLAVEDHVGGRFRPHPQMAELLERTITATTEIFRHHAPPRPDALAAELVSLVSLVLGSEEGCKATLGRTGRTLTRQRIVEHIEANLSDPALTPRDIARSLQISRSYLYALFADSNSTVASFIHARRLQAAYEMLVADPTGGLTVSEVAFRTGFKSVSHFSRSFSRHFRSTPRDVRAGARALPAQVEPA